MNTVKNKKTVLVYIVLLVSLVACNMSFDQAAPVTASGVLSYLLITPNPNASKTPTPYQPVTSTPRPTNLPTVTPTLVPSPTSSPTGIPTALPTLAGVKPTGQVRIMVLGSDARPGGGYRTDIMMMVTINPGTGNVTVLSFPRDLYVNIPGWGMNRINTAMEFGGFPMLASTIETNFGVRPNHYILTTFNSFLSIIDSLGGVDVVASQPLSDKCKNIKTPIAKNNYCYVPVGTTHMNSDLALWYVRSRHTTSDLDRERRSQEVLQAMFQKLFSLDALTRVPQLYDLYRKNVETDLTVNDIIGLAPITAGLALDHNKIRRYTIAGGAVYDYTVPGSGAMVLMPNMDVILGIIQQAVLTP